MDQMADAGSRPLSRKEHLTREESLRLFSILRKEKAAQIFLASQTNSWYKIFSKKDKLSFQVKRLKYLGKFWSDLKMPRNVKITYVPEFASRTTPPFLPALHLDQLIFTFAILQKTS